MGKTRRPFAFHMLGVGLAAVVTLGLGGCATADAEPGASSTPSEEPSASASTPVVTTTPSVDPVLVVGASERPPLPAHGDCTDIVTAAELTGAMGMDASEVEVYPDDIVRNLGGVSCRSNVGGWTLTIDAIPQSTVSDVDFDGTAVEEVLDYCGDILCTWQWEDEGWWIAGTTGYGEPLTQEEFDAWGEAIGPIVAANLTAVAPEPWQREKTGWWPEVECETYALAVGEQLGTDVTARSAAGYHDGASAARTAGDLYARTTACLLESASLGQLAEIRARSGMAWIADESTRAIGAELGGATLDEVPYGWGYSSGPSYFLRQGPNVMSLSLFSDAVASADETAIALSEAWLEVVR